MILYFFEGMKTV